MGSLLGLVAASIQISIGLVGGLKDDSARLRDHNVPYASAVASAALNAKGIANDERGFLMTGNPRFVEEATRRTSAAEAEFAAATTAAASPLQRQAVAEAHSAFEQWIVKVRVEFAAFRLGERHRSVAVAMGPNRALRKSYEHLLGQAKALGATAIESTETSFAKESSRSVTILVAWLCGATAIGLGVMFWLLRAIAIPMRNLMAMLAGDTGQINP